MQRSLLWMLAVLAPVTCSVSPRNLKIEYCVSYWAGNITCYWDPGQDTSLWNTYTLHVTEQAGRCRRDFGPSQSCVALQGARSCSLPVENLFAFYKIQLTAWDRLQEESSLEWCVHGMSVVKLSPPEVTALAANESRCFQIKWSLPGDEVMSAAEAQYEIAYHDSAEVSWTQVNFTATENEQAFAKVCGVSPFTNYSVRVRAKYLRNASIQSDGDPSWSEWSPERFVTTRPAAPSTGPPLWRKLGPPGADGMREVVLMWKPLKPKDANGEIRAYNLHSQTNGQPAVLQCLTPNLQCALSLPAEERLTFFVTATNSAGTSPPTELTIPASGVRGESPPTPLPVLASPAGNHSLLLQWPLPSSPRMGYVFEWRRLPGKPDDEMHWCYQQGGADHVVLAEAIEPGYLYGLKFFGLIHGDVWALGSSSVYSKQVAPRRAPALYATRVGTSQVEVRWDQIPLEERGGVIRNYTICYEEEGTGEQSVVVLESSVYRYLIEGLSPGSVVKVSITAANGGGSAKGPPLSVRTKSYDYGDVELLLSVLCVGSFLFLLLLLRSLACLCKHQPLQNYLWPQIPDPAKSNLATWTPHKMCLDLSPRHPRRWSQGYLGFTVGDLLRVLPSKPEKAEAKAFLGNTWLPEVPGMLHEHPVPSPLSGNGESTWGNVRRSHKHAASCNEVEYSSVVAFQQGRGSKEPWPKPLSKHQDPISSCSGSKLSQGVWLQNLTYATLLASPSCNKALKPACECPAPAAGEGVLRPAESPHQAPTRKKLAYLARSL